MVKRILYLMLFAVSTIANGQNFKQNTESSGGLGHGEVFNPFKEHPKDSTKSDVVVPKEIHQWKIDRKLGNRIEINADTLQFMFQNWHLTEGVNGEYNHLGNMGTPRESRIYFNRPTSTTFDFLQPFDYFFITPDRFIFTDTKSPYTNLSYHSSGNKVDGDDRFRAYFTTNAGKHFGVGFLFDYLYGRGRYDKQSTSQINFSLFSFYKSDKYNYHLLASRYRMKQRENGGITDDRYITRPEDTDGGGSNMGTADIPVKLDATWSRNEVYDIFFTHNYNWGYYRNNESKSADTTNVASDSIKAMTKTMPVIEENEGSVAPEFVSVARLTHTADVMFLRHQYINHRLPNNYYADTYLPHDSVDDANDLSINNRVSLSLCEGFRKWAFANITAFAEYKYDRYRLPDTITGAPSPEYEKNYNEHSLFVGGEISSTRGKHLRYHAGGATAIIGEELGAFSIDGGIDCNFKLRKRDFNVSAKAFIKNNRPSFFYRHYHSEHFWWDNDLAKEFRTRIEGSIEVPFTRTKLDVKFENVKNYTYIANHSILAPNGKDYLNRFNVEQETKSIQVFAASLKQDFKYKIFNLNTEVTYQHSSNQRVLPLPHLNAYANFYLKFTIAKVLHTELGADAWYFTSYYAPEYMPALGQFVQQNQADKIKIGNYPVASVYANFLLKKTRFYVKYYHVNKGLGKSNYFLTPHHPLTPSVLWFGLSCNFYN
ncbi:MAG: putative porin [Bacteroidaceae bacterium]|nr:putative porin [Bacteroidaceae bacterium]